MKKLSLIFLFVLPAIIIFSQNDLIPVSRVSSSDGDLSSTQFVVDGDMTSHWQSQKKEDEKWLFLVFQYLAEVKKVKINMEAKSQQAIAAFALQTYINGRWENRKEETNNNKKEITIEFEKPILNDRLRLILFSKQAVQVKEVEVFGNKYVAKDATPVKDNLSLSQRKIPASL